MARPPRVPTPGSFVHVFDHAVGSEPLFRDDADRRMFLWSLGTTASRQRWGMLAWCLMGNHVHLLVHDREGNLSEGMRRLKSLYATLHNRRHRRFGPLFSGRFGARHVLDEAYLMHAIRYVVLTPVAAHLVSHPSQWPWSSYRATAGLDSVPAWSGTESVLQQFWWEPTRARELFCMFIEEGIGRKPFDFRAAAKRDRREGAVRLGNVNGGVRAPGSSAESTSAD